MHIFDSVSLHFNLDRNPAWGVRNFIALFGNSFEVRGAENINRNKGGLVLINHQSIIDISG